MMVLWYYGFEPAFNREVVSCWLKEWKVDDLML